MDISGGRNHLVVVTEDGNAVAWGGNENNQAKVPAKATNIAKLSFRLIIRTVLSKKTALL